MTAVSRLPQADPLYTGPAPERPAYATGMLLDAGDFLDEQTYHRGRLAHALAFLSGGGTLAGLRVGHVPPTDDQAEEIEVAPGLAVDRIGRLIELPRPACLRLERWWQAPGSDGDPGDQLVQAAYDDPGRFISARATAEAGVDGAPPVPARAVVADVYLRFIACARGYTPSFASGPYDALDSVVTSRLRDAYELQLLPRPGLDDDFDGLPIPPVQLDGDDAARRAQVQDAVLDSWPERGRTGSGIDGELPRGPEHTIDGDPTAQWLARVLIPVAAGNPPQRDGSAVLVDNWPRRFVPSSQLMQHWLGLAGPP